MHIVLATLAEFASTSHDGKLNILGVLDEIVAPSQFPYASPLMYLVASYVAASEEFGAACPTRVTLRSVDGKTIFTMNKSLVVPIVTGRSSVRVHQIFALPEITFDEPGRYKFSIYLADEEVRSLPLTVAEGSDTSRGQVPEC